MSTSPYSEDLRKKVIDYLLGGNSQRSAIGIFKLNPSTISRWWLRYKKEGHYAPRKRLGKKPNLGEEELKEYLKLHPQARTLDIGDKFGMSSVGAFYWLKKLGFSYKKKPLPTWKLMKRSELNI